MGAAVTLLFLLVACGSNAPAVDPPSPEPAPTPAPTPSPGQPASSVFPDDPVADVHLATPTSRTCLVALVQRGDAHACDVRTRVVGSFDSGLTWAETLDNESTFQEWFFTDGRAWLVTDRLCAGILPEHYTSTDGGASWSFADGVEGSLVPDPPQPTTVSFDRVRFRDATTGAMRWNDAWLVTADGGDTWRFDAAAPEGVTPWYDEASTHTAEDPACRLVETDDTWSLQRRGEDGWADVVSLGHRTP